MRLGVAVGATTSEHATDVNRFSEDSPVECDEWSVVEVWSRLNLLHVDILGSGFHVISPGPAGLGSEE